MLYKTVSKSLDKYFIDEKIFDVKFSCDLQMCKGCCCTIKGTIGAPLLEEEIIKIESILNTVKKYLSDINREWIDKKGFYEKLGNEITMNNVLNDDCVFSYCENDIAKCAFQKAYYEKETDFIKPISCHLFPIRVNGKKRNVLKYEKIDECKGALDKGEAENVSLIKFVKDGLIRECGREFYKSLRRREVH